MNNTSNFNEVKTLITSLLESYNLTNAQIENMVTDDFINGFISLSENEPIENKFLYLARNALTEINLVKLDNLETVFRNEIITGGYFCTVLQYVVDAWRNIQSGNNQEYTDY